MSIQEEIKAHTRAVLNGEVSRDQGSCPKCGTFHGSFRPHERKRRSFLIIVDRLVCTMASFLMRWECLLCNQTFTEYPPFALPYKRYVKGEVLKSSQRYVEEDRATYESVIRVKGMPVCYEGKGEEIDDRRLAPSTLWRWVVFLGGMKKTLQEALGLIRQKAPSSGIFREVYPIAPSKYRSDGRRIVLQRCLKLFRAEGEYLPLFGTSIFLQLATARFFR
jgi:hypothetical protein